MNLRMSAQRILTPLEHLNPSHPTEEKHMRANAVSYLTTGIACLAASILSLHAQGLEAILPSQEYAPEGWGATVFIHPTSGDVLVGGSRWGAASAGAALHRLVPTGASLSATPLDTGLSVVSRIACDSAGVLYAAGRSPVTLSRNTTVDYWDVRESTDGGNSWHTFDTFYLGKGTSYSVAKGAMVDARENVYVCGLAMNGRTPYWVVRRKQPGGLFATVLSLRGQDYSEPFEMGFCPANGAIFVVGLLNAKWTVLRSLNQGDTWDPVGPWPSDGAMATAWDIACDAQGKVYVVGARGRNGFNRGWVVRMSEDGGDTWRDLLDQPDATGAWAAGVAVDEAGHVMVSGTILISTPSGTLPRWTVMRNRPLQPWFGSASASWETRFRPFGDITYSKGAGLASDALGNVYLTGEVANWTDATVPQEPVTYAGSRFGLLRWVP